MDENPQTADNIPQIYINPETPAEDIPKLRLSVPGSSHESETSDELQKSKSSKSSQEIGQPNV